MRSRSKARHVIINDVVPSAWIAAFVGGTVFRGKFVQSLWVLGHLVAYLLLFYAVARATFGWSSRPSSRVGRATIQVAVLLALFSCSFLRAITYSSIQGQGGTYTLWGAVSRYLDKYPAR